MSHETDLQELLHQIDIMVSHRSQEWEERNQELCTRLQARETQLMHSRMQVRHLQRRAEETERVQRETVRGYEDRLGRLRSELEKLKASFARPQGPRRSEGAGAAQEQDSSFESPALSVKLEELKVKSREWEKQRGLRQKDLAALEANRKLLAVKCHHLQLQSALAGGPRAEIPEPHTPPGATQEGPRVSEGAVGPLRSVPTSRRETGVQEDRSLPEGHTLQEESRDEVSMLRAELLARDDLVQATQLEEKQWKREAARLREQLSSQEIATRLEVEEKEGVVAAELWDLRQSVERVQRQLQSSIQQEERLREDIIQLQTGLESSHCQSQQLSDALNHTQEKLRDLEHSGKCKDNQIVTLQEKLVQQQAERSKMEAMRAETRHLRAQLRDSESTLASANRRAAQVQRELLSNTGKDTEYQVAKIQLEALRLENKNLKQLISKMESNTSLTPAGEVSGEVSGDSGQWEEESQPAETSFASEDPHGISSHVSPQAACWEQTEAPSPTPKPEDCYYPHGNSHGEEEFTAKVDRTKNTSAPMEPAVLTSPSLTRTIGASSSREEEHRMKSLEQRFDSYIQKLHSDTQRTLLKYGVCPPGEGHGPGAPEPGLNTRFTQQSVSPWDHEEPPVEPE